VPPNFITTVSAGPWGAASDTALKDSFRALRRPNYGRRRLVAAILVLVAAALAVAGVKSLTRESHVKPPATAATGATGPASRTSFLQRVVPATREIGPNVPRSVAGLANRLPVERKVAQLFLVGFIGTGANAPVFSELAQRDVGGIVFLADNYTSPQQLRGLTAAARQVARRHKRVPPWLMTIQDGGEFSELAGLPPADAPSAISDVDRAAAEAGQAARSLHALGINGVLGPEVDVDTDPGGPYTRIAFSNDPTEVGQFAAATVRAYTRQRIFTAPKHFPGLGAADNPTSDGDATVGLSLDQLAARDLVPFKAALDAGSQGVLIGHGLYTTDNFATPASQSNALIQQLLRTNLRFNGVAVTDDLEDRAIVDTMTVPAAAVASIQAGADMVYISDPADQEAAYQAVLSAARNGKIPSSRLDAAVEHILAAKQKLHLIA
jgi:beta-N-acetylhexosaminidase